MNKFICIIFWIPHISNIIWYLSFSVWLTSLSMITSRSINCCKWHYFILQKVTLVFQTKGLVGQWLLVCCSWVTTRAAAAAKSLQSCPTLCDPRDGSPPGSPVPGILQARTLKWVAVPFSNGWKWKVKVKSLSRVWPSATPWIAAFQAPPSMGFSRQEYWSEVPLPSTSNGTLYLNSILQPSNGKFDCMLMIPKLVSPNLCLHLGL